MEAVTRAGAGGSGIKGLEGCEAPAEAKQGLPFLSVVSKANPHFTAAEHLEWGISLSPM